MSLRSQPISRRQFLGWASAAALGVGVGGLAGAQAASRKRQEKKQAAMREAMFYEKLDGGRVRCRICFRECVVPPGGRGFCRNRENRDGTFYNLVHGRPSAIHVDPVEKEPQHHFLPGSDILCFGTAGCNFRCLHCQNWHLSQRPIEEMEICHDVTPEQAVGLALARKIPTISFTYNDPIAFYEYLYDIARLARPKGVRIMWHSNGTFGREALEELLRCTDTVTIDLKGFTEDFYGKVSSARLAPVLENLKLIRSRGVWLEIVNLVIPGLNDRAEDLRRMCDWIVAELGPDVPLHFSRFHPAYKLTHLPPTPVATLERAHAIAREAGLRFVSIGNVPGHPYNSTFCPRCGERVIRRFHFEVLENHVRDGRCGFCGQTIPGVWA